MSSCHSCRDRMFGYPQFTPRRKMPKWGYFLIEVIIAMICIFALFKLAYPAEDSGSLPKKPIKSLRQAKSPYETSFVIDQINTNGRLSQGNYSDEQIVNAIFIIEGGHKAQYLYGIRSIKYKDIKEARRICLNTIRNNRKRYADYGYKEYPDYLSFLASRYCPVKGKLSKAEQRVNKYWLGNLRKRLAKGE